MCNSVTNFHLDILPPPQRRLWEMLDRTPPGFVLYGGTALALRLGHRQSIDFDFFSLSTFTPDELQKRIDYLAGGRAIQKAENTLTCTLDFDGEVNISFFGDVKLCSVRDPDCADGPGIHVASLLDLAATKAGVVQERASAKDYVDLDALMHTGVSLADALGAAGAVFGTEFNPLLTLKALTYYADGDLDEVPIEVRGNLTAAAAAIDLQRLPTFQPRSRLCPAAGANKNAP